MKQILEERKDLAKKKGTVLLTVVGVMMVLVVFLLSTLVLTASSNRRSYYTYYETQAQYAAQAALDSVTNSAYSNKDFYNWVSQKVLAGEAAKPITVEFDANSGIQFSNDTNVVNCTIERVPDNYVWDEDTKAIHAQRAWKITATASVGNGRNQADYTVCNYIYENYRAPEDGLTSGVQNEAQSTVFTGSTEENNNAAIALGTIQLGNAGITGNVKYLGPQISGQGSIPAGRLIYPGAPNYNIALGNDNYSIGNILFVNNVDIAVEARGEFQRAGEGAIYYGNINCTNKGFAWETNIAASYAPTSYNNLNYVYVDGTISNLSEASGGLFVGMSKGHVLGTHPVNLYAGAVNVPKIGSELAVYGDTYLYDRSLDSTWCGEAAVTQLTRFMANNLTKGNVFEGNGQPSSGSLFCNNNSLTLGGNRSFYCAGDLVFTNPNGVLTLLSNTYVGGHVYCAGTITGKDKLLDFDTGAPLDASRIHDKESDVASYFDSAYVTYARSGIDDYNGAANNSQMNLFPFQYRLDEIFQKYYRWDLQCVSAEAATNAINTDPLIDESWRCGHDWYVAEFDAPCEQYSVTTTEVLLHDGDPGFAWSVPGASYFWDAEVGKNAMKKVNVERTLIASGTKTYVPYTVPVNSGNAFIEEYQYVKPDSYMSQISAAGYAAIDDAAVFQSKMGAAAPTVSSGGGDNVRILFHDYSGEPQHMDLTAKYVSQSCTLDISAGGTVLIDPSVRPNKEIPLYIYLTGSKEGVDILINNTASYATGLDSPTAYYDEASPGSSIVANHGEVYIFFDTNVFLSKCRIMTTGLYGKMGGTYNGVINMVQNPIYPTDPNFGSVDAAYKFAYEIVPNALILGQKGNDYTGFTNGFFWNAEILMPTSALTYGTGNFVCPDVNYREEWNSGTFTATTNYLVGVGASMIDSTHLNDNWASIAYIGDKNRKVIETIDYGNNSSDLGADNKDYLHNNYQGAS